MTLTFLFLFMDQYNLLEMKIIDDMYNVYTRITQNVNGKIDIDHVNNM